MPTPIALFAFNRPAHLRSTLDALASNNLARESALTIFCDGPRSDAEKELTDAVRALCREESCKGRFAEVQLVEHAKNRGLASSIIAGVTQMLERHECVIVLEDDLATSPYFLQFMNDALAVYAEDKRVASIHGYCFPHAVPNPPETFFLPGADCWGWATWRRAWNIFEPDAAALLAQLDARGLRRAFNLNNCYPYYEMLEDARDGKVSSWAVRWHASAFLADMWTLHPGRSLVFHAGNDSSGTHCGTDTLLDTDLATTSVPVQKISVKTHTVMANAFQQFSLRASGGRWALFKQKIKRSLKSWKGK